MDQISLQNARGNSVLVIDGMVGVDVLVSAEAETGIAGDEDQGGVMSADRRIEAVMTVPQRTGLEETVLLADGMTQGQPGARRDRVVGIFVVSAQPERNDPNEQDVVSQNQRGSRRSPRVYSSPERYR